MAALACPTVVGAHGSELARGGVTRQGAAMSMDAAPEKRPRYQLIDALRGVAIGLMVVFHVAWDLYYLGFSDIDVTTDPAWMAFQRLILSSFLVLAGVSLWLGHGAGIRWTSFLRRLGVLMAAAVAVTLGTWVAFGDYFSYFGVLHAIALFSLLALPLLGARLWLVAIIAAAVLIPPGLVSFPVMRERWLSWIGFWPLSPATSDIVPIFPWFGVFLVGIIAVRLLAGTGLWPRITAWRAHGMGRRWLVLAGRWSLLIYLVHQPLLYGVLYPLHLVMHPSTETQAAEFVASCRATRAAFEPDPLAVERYCGCALEQVEAGNLWEMLSRERTAEEELQVNAMTSLCTQMAATPIEPVPELPVE
jgi:uncharacterized membrane protein